MTIAKTFAAALAASTIAGSAFAADLPSRKAPVAVAPLPMLTWTGFYIGLNAGGVFGGNARSNVAGTPIVNNGTAGAIAVQAANDLAMTGTTTGSGSRGGFIGGGQIGYNWQMGSLVAGLEADIQGLATGGGSSTLLGIQPIPGFAGFTSTVATTVTNKTVWLGTVRGRLGFAVTPTWLLYGTNGLAYGGVKSSTAITGFVAPGVGSNTTGAANSNNARVGWTLGAGAEWRFASNWSAKIEYLYYNLGSSTYSVPNTTITGAGVWVSNDVAMVRSRNDGHIVRAGVNYYFGGPAGPVVAKY